MSCLALSVIAAASGDRSTLPDTALRRGVGANGNDSSISSSMSVNASSGAAASTTSASPCVECLQLGVRTRQQQLRLLRDGELERLQAALAEHGQAAFDRHRQRGSSARITPTDDAPGDRRRAFRRRQASATRAWPHRVEFAGELLTAGRQAERIEAPCSRRPSTPVHRRLRAACGLRIGARSPLLAQRAGDRPRHRIHRSQSKHSIIARLPDTVKEKRGNKDFARESAARSRLGLALSAARCWSASAFLSWSSAPQIDESPHAGERPAADRGAARAGEGARGGTSLP